MKKSFLLITETGRNGANKGTYELYQIVNNVPKIVSEGDINERFPRLKTFALKQLVKAGIIKMPVDSTGDSIDWDLIRDVTLTIVEGKGLNNITIIPATKPEWGGEEFLASWLLGCDETDIQYLVEQSEKLDMPYEDVTDYLTGGMPSANAYIKEMQRVLIHRANQALNPDLEDAENFTNILEEGKHYLIGSDVKIAFIVPEDYNIVRDFGAELAQEAINILSQWGSR